MVLIFCLQFLVASYYDVALNYIDPGDNLTNETNPFFDPFYTKTDRSVKAFYNYIIDNRNLLNPHYKPPKLITSTFTT